MSQGREIDSGTERAGMQEGAPMARRGQPVVLSIQYLRALAALAVVIYHSSTDANWPKLGVLSSGVDVFFVISGFIMWTTTVGRDVSPLSFWRRRVERIVPLYWLITSVALIASVVAPNLGGITTVWHVVSSYLFFPSVNPDTLRVEPLVSPGWTLNYEMFFYLIFGISLLVAVRYRWLAVALVIAVAVALVGVVPGVAGDFYSNTIMLEFVFGLVIAVFVVRIPPLSRPAALFLAAISVVLLFGLWELGTSRVLGFGLPGALIVATCVANERAQNWPEWRPLRLMGDASYSIYICHGLVLTGLTKVVETSGVPLTAMLLVGPVVAVGSGIAVYFFVERPMSRRLASRRRGATLRRSAEAPTHL